MDPRSAQVLAMASPPSYDNSVFGPPVDAAGAAAAGRRAGSPMLEHVTQVAAPPGSTFKLVVAAANMRIRSSPRSGPPDRGRLHLRRPHLRQLDAPGPDEPAAGDRVSNNVYFYQLAWARGRSAMISAARSLGVGRPTGIDLPGEQRLPRHPGVGRPDGGTWYAGSTVILGIGQGYLRSRRCRTRSGPPASPPGLVTPRSVWPSERGRARSRRSPRRPRRPLPFADALGPVRDGMRAAATGGTALRLADLPAPVGAKTGTAQNGGLPEGSYDNWMTAAAPIEAPEIVVTALVQGPGTGATAPRTSRPTACATTSSTARTSSRPDRCRTPDDQLRP